MSSVLPERDKDGRIVQRMLPFTSADGLKFKGTGLKGVCTKNSTSHIQYKLTETRFFNGIELFIKDQVWDDTIALQVVDVDNILGQGADFVADEFGTDWNLTTDTERQGPYIVSYPSLIFSGLYIRIVYTSTGTVNDVKLKANLFLHKKPA